MIEAAFNAAGGLALFMLAMTMMTGGLKLFGGAGLKSILQNWTSSPIKGVLSGALLTAVVQSSSAVTVATIGFVNAGILSLHRALSVIFGANVGTTMTGWLVSLVGFGFKIEAFALPLLAIGVGLRLLSPGARVKGLGEALAGFGLFFLGLSILKDAFSIYASDAGSIDFEAAGETARLLAFLGMGVVATVLTQSSSAAIAIVLTAASQGVIGLEEAATAIVGANIGTTSTAILAVVGATPASRRVAVGHVLFNASTAVVALLLLPLVLAGLRAFGGATGFGDQPAPLLALFHTVFNLLGVCICLPFLDRIARMLERLFRSAEEDLATPRFLDRNVLGMPVMAAEALHQELNRQHEAVEQLAADVLTPSPPPPSSLRRRADAVVALTDAISAFATSFRMETLPRDLSEQLPEIVRVARHHETAAHLAQGVIGLRAQLPGRGQHPRLVEKAMSTAAGTLDSSLDSAAREARVALFREAYQSAKSALLQDAVARVIGVDQAEQILDDLSSLRRMVEELQAAHARMLPRQPETGSDGEQTGHSAMSADSPSG
ncbi:MAG: Na/Pi cotransporter family protein [Minwuia sp.]|uniref:Na/Pi cotransporter family protein n=1 Tax=Minwuia sp. TaxID=2493630 RepID=UPI003A83B2BD